MRLGLIDGAVEGSTRSGYSTAIRDWKRFVELYGFDDRPTVESLSTYIAYAIRRIRSVPTYLSGLAFFFKPIYDDWDQVRNSFEVKRTLRGALKWRAHTVSRKAALRIPQLRLIIARAVDTAATFDDLLFAVVSVMGFFALHRLGELTVKSASAWDPSKLLLWSSASWDGDHLVYWLPYHKADKFYNGSECRIDCSLAPKLGVRELLEMYILARQAQTAASPYLLCYANGAPPTYSWYVSRLQSLFGTDFAGHSLRSGGATFLAELGARDCDIKRMGRWAGDSFEEYLRRHPAVFFALARTARANGTAPPSIWPEGDD